MVGLNEFGVYIACRHNTVAQYIATCPIMEFCLAAERKTGMKLSKRCWEYPALDIPGIRAGHSESVVGWETGT